MKTLMLLILFLSPFVCEAKIGLKIGLIYKKGIGKGFFLSTEQHSIQSVDDHEQVFVQMKNGIKADVSAFYVQGIHEYGPSGFVRLKRDIFNMQGKIVKTIGPGEGDVYLGQTTKIVFVERNEEQIELTISPISI